jgi:hypothetical protein
MDSTPTQAGWAAHASEPSSGNVACSSPPMQALALAALLLADAAPRAGAVSPLHRFLPSEGGAWPAARTLPGAHTTGTALSWRRRTEDRPWRSLTCEESTEDVSDATGVPHPYVYEVSGLGARVLLHGTVHVSTFLLYGGEHGGPPREVSQALADADAVYTEVDLHELCEPDEDGMGSPDCSASLGGSAPAARHFSTAERERIADVLTDTSQSWHADLHRNLSEAWQGSSCDVPKWLEWLDEEDMTEPELEGLWGRFPASNMPWRSLSSWRCGKNAFF